MLIPFFALTLVAQAPAPRRAQAAPGTPALPGIPPASMPDAAEPKPYDKVITAKAVTQDGLFKVHRLNGKVYFELPKAQLDRKLLLVATAAQVPAGYDHAGRAVGEEVVRFTLQENRVFFQTVSYNLMSDPTKPIAPAVAASQRDTVLLAFNVEAFAKDGAPVIDVTRLFTTEVSDFSARMLLNATMMDTSRSYVDKVKVFPTNLRVDAVQTYALSSAFPGMTPIPGMPMPPPRSGSVLMAYSFVQLPEQPMAPRLHDDRVGFFTVSHVDYGSPEHEAKRERFITRWRLEKKDPTAALSEPVKPIVWYLDRATPAEWVPYVKKGVEAWNVAFEAAGFKNAVQARPFPTKEEDPEFDPEDVRYSIIRWVPSPIANAYGPHLSDPRSGEILNANIILYHNILQLQRDWYFTQVGPLDKRAEKLPLPEELMGELLAYVVTHECGHSLGFPHNMKASSTYPVDKLRDKAWLKEMGHVPTLMDYSRFNYVAQPEDGVDPELLRPKIGPYDLFAVRWGYRPIPEAATPAQEKATLDSWAREQDTKPWLRFSTPRALGADVGDNTEAVGDADAVKATGLGTRNLKRVVAMLPAAADKPGENVDTLEHLYRGVWGQWNLELNHVAVIVGGFETHNKHAGQPGEMFTPVSRARQKEAVAFLNETLFKTPKWLLPMGILNRLSPLEGTQRLLTVQKNVLGTLLDRNRTQRMEETEALAGDQAYRLTDLLADLQGGLFTELTGPGRPIDTYRRNLQRGYLEVIDDRLNRAAPFRPFPDDTRGALRSALKAIQTQVAPKVALTRDKATKAHLEDLKDQITRILEPKFAPAPQAPVMMRMGLQEGDCWPGVE
jgi:hypothetical protein